MKMINKLMVVLGLAVTLVGCGDNPQMLSDKDLKPEPVASAYLNENLGEPSGAGSSWKVEVKNENGARMVRLFVDGKKSGWTVCQPASSTYMKAPVCRIVFTNAVKAVHWDDEEGYRVFTSAAPRIYSDYSIDGEEAMAFLDGLRPYFKEGYL